MSAVSGIAGPLSNSGDVESNWQTSDHRSTSGNTAVIAE